MTIDLWEQTLPPLIVQMQTSPQVSLNKSTERNEQENLELFETVFGETDVLEVETEWLHDLANALVRCAPAKGNLSR